MSPDQESNPGLASNNRDAAKEAITILSESRKAVQEMEAGRQKQVAALAQLNQSIEASRSKDVTPTQTEAQLQARLNKPSENFLMQLPGGYYWQLLRDEYRTQFIPKKGNLAISELKANQTYAQFYERIHDAMCEEIAKCGLPALRDKVAAYRPGDAIALLCEARDVNLAKGNDESSEGEAIFTLLISRATLPSKEILASERVGLQSRLLEDPLVHAIHQNLLAKGYIPSDFM